MKFSCDRCHTRYSIPDERVKGKVLKIRCKTCGNVITVGGRKKRERKTTDSSPARRARAVRPKASAVGLPTAVQPAAHHQSGPAPRTAGRDAPKEKRGRATVSRGPEAHPAVQQDSGPGRDIDEPGFGEKTVVSDPNIDMAALRAELAVGPPTVSDLPAQPHRPEAKSPPEELEEWYLADDHGEYGPMTFSELAARIRRREHGPDAQVWREGFADWMDLEAVPELRPHLKHVPPPRVRHHENWAEAEPAAAPVKLTAPPPELEPKPQRSPDPLPAVQARLAPDATSAPQDDTRSAARTARPPKRKDIDAFFGKDRLEPDSEDPISSPVPVLGSAEVAAPALVPAVQPGDKNKLFAVLFAIIGAVALLALTGLVIYLLTNDRGRPQSSKPTNVAQRQDQSTQPMAPQNNGKTGNESSSSKPKAQPRQDDSDNDDMIMDPVELSLPSHAAKSRGPARAKSRSISSAGHASSSGRSTGLGSSFSTGSFGGFGPVGIRERRGVGPRVTSSRPRAIRATRKVTKPEVMAVIRRHVHRLKRCYERAVRLHPTDLRRAKMKVTIKISASGRVTRVGITPGRYRGLSLGDCLVSTIRSWKFPPSTTSYGTGFPLSFVGK